MGDKTSGKNMSGEIHNTISTPSTHIALSEEQIPDAGFCENDILKSMENQKQIHIQWIYECMLCRMDENITRHFGIAEHGLVRLKAKKTYAIYASKIENTQAM